MLGETVNKRAVCILLECNPCLKYSHLILFFFLFGDSPLPPCSISCYDIRLCNVTLRAKSYFRHHKQLLVSNLAITIPTQSVAISVLCNFGWQTVQHHEKKCHNFIAHQQNGGLRDILTSFSPTRKHHNLHFPSSKIHKELHSSSITRTVPNSTPPPVSWFSSHRASMYMSQIRILEKSDQFWRNQTSSKSRSKSKII